MMLVAHATVIFRNVVSPGRPCGAGGPAVVRQGCRRGNEVGGGPPEGGWSRGGGDRPAPPPR